MSLTTASELSDVFGATATSDCGDAEPVNTPGSAATAQVAFKKSRNSLRDIIVDLLCKSSARRGRGTRLFDLLHEHVGDLCRDGARQRIDLATRDHRPALRVNDHERQLAAEGCPVKL